MLEQNSEQEMLLIVNDRTVEIYLASIYQQSINRKNTRAWIMCIHTRALFIPTLTSPPFAGATLGVIVLLVMTYKRTSVNMCVCV